MLIAQITDTHVGFDRGNPDEANFRRLTAAVRHLAEGPNRPDLVLLTGDLTEFGDAGSYVRLAEAVRPCPCPVWPMVGNHDARAALLAGFPDTPLAGGFVQYALEFDALRLLVLDTLEPGRHGGAFCADRAAWLKARLAERPDVPTIIAMHHPPFAAGLAWLDSDPGEAWIARFADAIGGHGQVAGIVCGHLHRTIHTQWNGVALTVSGSTAPGVALDLRPVDSERPDGRAMIVDDLPSYALHWWDGTRLISHAETVGHGAVLARYDDSMRGIVRTVAQERES